MRSILTLPSRHRAFFSISRLRSSARGRQLVVLRLHQEGIEAAAVIDRFQRIGRDAQRAPSGSSASEISVTLHRLGRNRRLVLRFEWLTLWPVCAALPVSSHRRDMVNSSTLLAPATRAPGWVSSWEACGTYSEGRRHASRKARLMTGRKPGCADARGRRPRRTRGLPVAHGWIGRRSAIRPAMTPTTLTAEPAARHRHPGHHPGQRRAFRQPLLHPGPAAAVSADARRVRRELRRARRRADRLQRDLGGDADTGRLPGRPRQRARRAGRRARCSAPARSRCASLASAFWVFVAMFALLGLANTVYHPADYALLSHRVSAPRMSKAYSIHTFSGILGSAVAPASLLFLAASFGWRGAFLGAAVLGFAVAALLMLGGRRDGRPRRAAGKAEGAGARPPQRLELAPPAHAGDPAQSRVLLHAVARQRRRAELFGGRARGHARHAVSRSPTSRSPPIY